MMIAAMARNHNHRRRINGINRIIRIGLDVNGGDREDGFNHQAAVAVGHNGATAEGPEADASSGDKESFLEKIFTG